MSRCLFYFHVVWATQSRQPLLTEEREQAVFRLIMTTARDCDVEVLAVNGMPDHVHVVMKTGAVVDMPHLMKQIKGITSAHLNHLHPAERFRWQGGYYAATVTPSHVPRIVAYIQHQKEHHAAGTTQDFWEQTEETEENS